MNKWVNESGPGRCRVRIFLMWFLPRFQKKQRKAEGEENPSPRVKGRRTGDRVSQGVIHGRNAPKKRSLRDHPHDPVVETQMMSHPEAPEGPFCTDLGFGVARTGWKFSE